MVFISVSNHCQTALLLIRLETLTPITAISLLVCQQHFILISPAKLGVIMQPTPSQPNTCTSVHPCLKLGTDHSLSHLYHMNYCAALKRAALLITSLAVCRRAYMLLQTALQQPAAVPHCCHCRCTICHLMIYTLPHSAHHPCCQNGLLLQPAGTKALVQLHCSMAPDPACGPLLPVKYSAQTTSQKMLSTGNVFLSSAHECTFIMIPLGLL